MVVKVGRSVCLSVENFKISSFRGLTCLNLKTILARYTNQGVISIPSRNRFLVWASLKKIGHPGTRKVGVCFGGLTCPNQNTILARYTNYRVISIPTHKRFLVWASLKKVGHPSTMELPVLGGLGGKFVKNRPSHHTMGMGWSTRTSPHCRQELRRGVREYNL